MISAKGGMWWEIALPVCLFGAVVGDCIMYYVGYHFGRGVLRGHRWFSRLITPEREQRIEENFRQHGLKAFFLARFLVGLHRESSLRPAFCGFPFGGSSSST